MKKPTFKVAVLAVATLGFVSLAAAQGPEGGHMRHSFGPGGPGGQMGHDGPGGPGFGHGGPGGLPLEMIARHLGLSDDQKAQGKAILEKERAAAEPLMKAAGEAKQAFDKTLESDSADAATVGQAAIAMRNAHKALEAQHKATFDAVKAILNPDQLAKLEEMEKHMGQRGPGGFGPGGPGGPGGQGMHRRQPKNSN